MAGALTLPATGRAPRGIARPWSQRITRVKLPPAPPLTARQQRALHDLTHEPGGARRRRRDRGGGAVDLVWAGLLVLCLAACVVAPLEDLGYLRGPGAVANEAQSSAGASRTM